MIYLVNLMYNEIFWAYVNFTNRSDGKRRPVLVIRQTETNYVVYRITTKYDNKSDWIKNKYLKISDWKQAGLQRLYWIDTIRPYNLPIVSTSLNYIGRLSDHDLHELMLIITKQS